MKCVNDMSVKFEEFIEKAGNTIYVLKERGQFNEPTDSNGSWLSGILGNDERSTNVYQLGKLQSELAK